MAQDTYGSPSAAPAQPAPKGAFGATNGGPQGMRDGSPDGGTFPNTQAGQIDHVDPGHGIQGMRDGSPEGGNFSDTQVGQIGHTPAGQGGAQRIPANRTPENGSGQGS